MFVKTFLAILVILAAAMASAERTGEEERVFGDIFQESSRSLAVDVRDQRRSNGYDHKCQREVPAIFFQTQKNEAVRGNGSTIHYHRLEVCCEGYRRSSVNWHRCEPDCSAVSPNNCRNGFCRAPNHCECFDEFVRNDHGDCIHTCPIACRHGQCYLNGTCECSYGYRLDPETRKFCRPVCATACGNHQECVAPGKCACADGYKMTSELGCQPVCIPDCGHGKCVGPNRCECFSGFMKRPQRNVCEAECYINCENGFCESRFKCQCRDGYKFDMNTTSCLPDCGDQCQDGICIAPGLCRCFEGYQLNGATCEPICHNGCGYYGQCLEPAKCGCAADSKQFCLNGTCDVNGRCLCAAGLTHFIDRCVEPPRLLALVSTYEQRDHYNEQLRAQFQGLIERHFQYSIDDS